MATTKPAPSIRLSLKPMEAEPVDDLPRSKGWLYKPKYDGFRCLALRDGEEAGAGLTNRRMSETGCEHKSWFKLHYKDALAGSV